MTRNRKSRTGGNRASLNTSKSTLNVISLVNCVKAKIVTSATGGLLSVAVRNWLFNLGGLHDV